MADQTFKQKLASMTEQELVELGMEMYKDIPAVLAELEERFCEDGSHWAIQSMEPYASG